MSKIKKLYTFSEIRNILNRPDKAIYSAIKKSLPNFSLDESKKFSKEQLTQIESELNNNP